MGKRRRIRSSSDRDTGDDDDESPSSPLSTPDVFGVAGADGSASMTAAVGVKAVCVCYVRKMIAVFGRYYAKRQRSSLSRITTALVEMQQTYGEHRHPALLMVWSVCCLLLFLNERLVVPNVECGPARK